MTTATRVLPRCVFVRKKGAAEKRVDPQDLEEIRRNKGARNLFGHIAARKVEAISRRRERGDMFKTMILFLTAPENPRRRRRYAWSSFCGLNKEILISLSGSG